MLRNPRWSRVAVAAALAAAFAVPLRAQDPSVDRRHASMVAIGAEVSRQSFQQDLDPWTLGSFSIWRRNSAGTFIARLNYADRFGTDGLQVEADAYPRLGEKTYLFLNLGYSSASVFPAWRSGAEFFTALPGAWEASLGYRQLRFNGVPVTMLTGAVGKYVGNYWISARPYLRTRDGSTTVSTTVQARRYFEDAEHWVGATASYGASPTERITLDAVGRSKATQVGVNGSTGVLQRLLVTWMLAYDSEELAPGRTRESFTVTAGFRRAY
jgi:YaiO family outer membrane protein